MEIARLNSTGPSLEVKLLIILQLFIIEKQHLFKLHPQYIASFHSVPSYCNLDPSYPTCIPQEGNIITYFVQNIDCEYSLDLPPRCGSKVPDAVLTSSMRF